LIDAAVLARAEALVGQCREAGITLATAESCTGGLVAAALTAVAGSSLVLDRGFVTYTNAAKREMLGVPAALIDAHGAVSEAVARAMAEGARARARVGMAVSVTGLAGPGGGTAEKPVGLVWIGLARAGAAAEAARHVFPGDRAAIRQAAVAAALAMLERGLGTPPAG
jgi:nicotinamide-nucleotide amidase